MTLSFEIKLTTHRSFHITNQTTELSQQVSIQSPLRTLLLHTLSFPVIFAVASVTTLSDPSSRYPYSLIYPLTISLHSSALIGTFSGLRSLIDRASRSQSRGVGLAARVAHQAAIFSSGDGFDGMVDGGVGGEVVDSRFCAGGVRENWKGGLFEGWWFDICGVGLVVLGGVVVLEVFFGQGVGKMLLMLYIAELVVHGRCLTCGCVLCVNKGGESDNTH